MKTLITIIFIAILVGCSAHRELFNNTAAIFGKICIDSSIRVTLVEEGTQATLHATCTKTQ